MDRRDVEAGRRKQRQTRCSTTSGVVDHGGLSTAQSESIRIRLRMSSSLITAAVAVAASVSSLVRVADAAVIIISIAATTTSINALAFAPPHHQNHPRRLQSSRGELRHHRRKYRSNSLPIIITTTTTTTSRSSLSSSSSSSSFPGETDDGTDQPTTMWDANTQTYLNGIVPSHHVSSSDIDKLLSLNGDGKLKIFGYGSLCWHAGSEGGVLSLADREEEDYEHYQNKKWPTKDSTTCTSTTYTTAATNNNHTKQRKGRVITSPGMAIGYQRCWSQRSADHRGTPQFNGIVCTLLSDEEVEKLQDEEITKQQQPSHPTLQPTTSSSGSRRRKVSMTEGLIYTVDEDLVQECLAELDFREKGGYARDIIDVVEVEVAENGSATTTPTPTTTTTVETKYTKALLYRGTPDNPAFWKRVIFDLPLVAAIISLAVGPSGANDVYLRRLHEFLLSTTHGQHASTLPDKGEGEGRSGDVRTGKLVRMLELLQSEYRPYIMFGAGSNEHNQLLSISKRVGESDVHCDEHANSSHDEKNGGNVNGNNDDDDDELDVYYSRQEVHELTEMLVVVPRMQYDIDNGEKDNGNDEADCGELLLSSNPRKVPADHDPCSLHAGGGHSALLTHGGDLFLWGWNEFGQLGRRTTTAPTMSTPFSSNLVPPLSNIKVAAVALGHTHTLVIEKGSGYLFGFGEDNRGQVSGRYRTRDGKSTTSQHAPRRIPFGLLEKERFIHVAAGLFHSAAIAEEGGELITWGCRRFGQCLRVEETPSPRQDDSEGASTVGRWRPPDGCKLVQVACGRRHTVVLDERGRVWTVGDNKYGQLGRDSGRGRDLSMIEPQLVNGPLGQVGSGCFAIYSGWSHVLALTRGADDRETSIKLYGWGRNDKGQLGLVGTGNQSIHEIHVLVPRVLKPPLLNTKSTPSSKEEDENSIYAACCGAESSHVIYSYGNMYSTGWNEHGNLAIGHHSGDGRELEDDHVMNWTATTRADLAAPYQPSKSEARRTMFAAGGAHLITSDAIFR